MSSNSEPLPSNGSTQPPSDSEAPLSTPADADAISTLAMPPPPKPSANSDSSQPRSPRSQALAMSSAIDTSDEKTVSGEGEDQAQSESTPTLSASQKNMPVSSSLPDAALTGGMRPPEPDLEPNRMSFSSLYNYGTGLYTAAKQAYGNGSAPSSVAGNSEVEGVQTSVHNVSGPPSQSGALSPSLNGSLREQSLSTRPYAPPVGPSSPGPHGVRGEGRTIRGRAPPSTDVYPAVFLHQHRRLRIVPLCLTHPISLALSEFALWTRKLARSHPETSSTDWLVRMVTSRL
jgi:hypothetical protein